MRDQPCSHGFFNCLAHGDRLSHSKNIPGNRGPAIKISSYKCLSANCRFIRACSLGNRLRFMVNISKKQLCKLISLPHSDVQEFKNTHILLLFQGDRQVQKKGLFLQCHRVTAFDWTCPFLILENYFPTFPSVRLLRLKPTAQLNSCLYLINKQMLYFKI